MLKVCARQWGRLTKFVCLLLLAIIACAVYRSNAIWAATTKHRMKGSNNRYHSDSAATTIAATEGLSRDSKNLVMSPSEMDGSETVFDFSPEQTSFDKSQQFKTRMFTVTGDKWTKLSLERKVCLGTQSSVDRLYLLVSLAQHWTGPISVALFVPDVEFVIGKTFIR